MHKVEPAGDAPDLAVLCPLCRGELILDATSGRCGECDRAYPVHDGVLRLSDAAVHVGEFTGEAMAEVLAAARSGSRDALCAVFRKHGRASMIDMLESPERTGFLRLLDVGANASVLDIGAGMGGVANQVAARVRRVVAMDQDPDRLQFLKMWTQNHGRDNVRAICANDPMALPFPDDSFDLVTMIGVLEYTPLARPEMSTADVQVKVLSEIRRVLRPGGQLVIGTKNRYGWQYLSGGRCHNGVRFGPALPMSIANALARRMFGRDYRIKVESASGYRSLARESGYADVRIASVFPGYQYSRVAFEGGRRTKLMPAGPASREFGPIKETVVNVLERAGLLKLVAPHCFVICTT